MAYGTETVPRVDVICGPGNAYVMEAKRQVYGSVGIDSLAGPSEVLVVADSTARPEWIAADMLAQEEHGSGAEALLMAADQGRCAKRWSGRSPAWSRIAPAVRRPRRHLAPAPRRRRRRPADLGRPPLLGLLPGGGRGLPGAGRRSGQQLRARAPGDPGGRPARLPRPGALGRRHLPGAAAPPPRSATTSPAATTCSPPEDRPASRRRSRWTRSCASRPLWRCPWTRPGFSPRAWPGSPTAKASSSTAARRSCAPKVASRRGLAGGVARAA